MPRFKVINKNNKLCYVFCHRYLQVHLQIASCLSCLIASATTRHLCRALTHHPLTSVRNSPLHHTSYVLNPKWHRFHSTDNRRLNTNLNHPSRPCWVRAPALAVLPDLHSHHSASASVRPLASTRTIRVIFLPPVWQPHTT